MQKTFSALAPQSIRRNFWLILALLIISVATGCIVDEEGDPQIISMTVSPNSISRSETGSTSEYFTVTIDIANFEDEVTSAEVYIQSPARTAEHGQIEIEGDTIILSQIAKTWFGNLEVGTYNLGATVRTDTVTVRENNLTTVTITD